jgi:hypothetical protein
MELKGMQFHPRSPSARPARIVAQQKPAARRLLAIVAQLRAQLAQRDERLCLGLQYDGPVWWNMHSSVHVGHRVVCAVGCMLERWLLVDDRRLAGASHDGSSNTHTQLPSCQATPCSGSATASSG